MSSVAKFTSEVGPDRECLEKSYPVSIDHSGPTALMCSAVRARTCKRLRSPGRFQEIDSANLCSLAESIPGGFKRLQMRAQLLESET
jgi:hypothetical protein